MKKILSEVSVADMRGPLNKFMELLENKKSGHYWLNQLTLLMRKEPTHILSDKWLKDLSKKTTWDKTERCYLCGGNFWFNEPEWPFQTCVLKIGGMTTSEIFIELSHSQPYFKSICTEEILDIPVLDEQKKILLLRIQARFLGFTKEFEFAQLNCIHPNFNLSPCPAETAFFLSRYIEGYYDSSPTMISMNFKPSNMVDLTKTRIYGFRDGNGNNRLDIVSWDIHPMKKFSPNTWFIFQYNPICR